jgi:hypothetical protein
MNNYFSEKELALSTKIEGLINEAEKSELEISSFSLIERSASGSFFTPPEVASFFVRIILNDNLVTDNESASQFLSDYVFIEPSSGSGIFIFSFLLELLKRGVNSKEIEKAEFIAIDINSKALKFVSHHLNIIDLNLNIRSIHIDFLKFNQDFIGKKKLFFGNPPYVKNDKNSEYPNLFAEFTRKSIGSIKKPNSVYFILPLSIAFSQVYSKLRTVIRDSNFRTTLYNFDNIPDSLFRFGKPGSINSNNANSQRCSIICLKPATKFSLFSTQLICWKKSEREKLFASTPDTLDVSSYAFDDQFPRPFSLRMLSYLESKTKMTLSMFVQKKGDFVLNVASVARNFISIRECSDSVSNSFTFQSRKDMLTFLAILCSKHFFEYWKTVGDGFHLTKKNILNFPVNADWVEKSHNNLIEIEEKWNNRERCLKARMIASRRVVSYDFSRDFYDFLDF